MKKSSYIVSSLAALSLLTVSACVTDPNTGEKKVSRTAIGGVGGKDDDQDRDIDGLPPSGRHGQTRALSL